MHGQFVEGLEGRTLFSASGAPAALSPAVQADHQQIHADLAKIKTDALGAASTLLADIGKLKADNPHAHLGVKTLVLKMHADLLSMRAKLAADRLAEATNVLVDETQLASDLKQVAKDQGNAAALKADHAKVLADRIKLQKDMVAGLSARIADRTANYQTIFNDGQAILTALQNNPNATPQLLADAQQWVTDRTNALSTLTADLQQLTADRTQLIADLTAQQSL